MADKGSDDNKACDEPIKMTTLTDIIKKIDPASTDPKDWEEYEQRWNEVKKTNLPYESVDYCVNLKFDGPCPPLDLYRKILADENEEYPHGDEFESPLVRLVTAIAENKTSYSVDHYEALSDVVYRSVEDFVYDKGGRYEVTHSSLTWLLDHAGCRETSNFERIVSLIEYMVSEDEMLWGQKPTEFSGAIHDVEPWDSVCQLWEHIHASSDIDNAEKVRLAKKYFVPTQDSYKSFLGEGPRESSDLEGFLADNGIDCLPFKALNPGRRKKKKQKQCHSITFEEYFNL